jgi:hypothetical protein
MNQLSENSVLSGRVWKLQFSFRRRLCYVSGSSIFLTFGYCGNKKIRSWSDKNKLIDDNIWLSKTEFTKRFPRVL